MDCTILIYSSVLIRPKVIAVNVLGLLQALLLTTTNIILLFVLYVPVIDVVITLRLALAFLIPYLHLVHLVGLSHLVRDTHCHVPDTSALSWRRHIVWPISTFLCTKYECINESTIVWSTLSSNLLVSFPKLLNRFRRKSILVTGYGRPWY
jgi:ethanolamine transporter EutH